jgi:hypothetical protein
MGTFMVLRELGFILTNLDKNRNCSIMRAGSLPCRVLHNICCAVYGLYVEVPLGLNELIRTVHCYGSIGLKIRTAIQRIRTIITNRMHYLFSIYFNN